MQQNKQIFKLSKISILIATLIGINSSNILAEELDKDNTTQVLDEIVVTDTINNNNDKDNKSTIDKNSNLYKAQKFAHQSKEKQGYSPKLTKVGKSIQEVKDIPQNISIISEKIMQDKNSYTMKEALRNVAGITFNAGEGGRIGDNITIRGYSAVGDLYLDGMRDMAQYNRETFNLSQIDVLKGSASMLFGRGSTGGLINQASKMPKLDDRYETSFTVGSDDYKRATIDLNKNIDNTNTSMRLNAMATKSHSFRDEVKQERYGIAPSIAFGLGTQDELNLSYYFLKENNIPDYGVPYLNGKPIDVPINRFYGLKTDYEKNKTGIATAAYTHIFNDDSTLKTTLRSANYNRDLRATAPRLVGNANILDDSIIVNRQRQARGGEEKTLSLQTDFNTKFKTKDIEHELLLGAEYVHEKAQRWTNTSSINNPQTNVGLTKDINLPSNFDASFTKTAFNSYKGNTLGLYMQDTINLTPQFKVLLGTRFDKTDADYNRPLPQGNLSREDNVWSYRGGLIYTPTTNSTYYAAYGTSFNPSAELYQLDDRTANTPPEKSRNMELGAKFNLLNNNLSLRTSIFRTEKTNERNTDLAAANLSVLSGKRHTDGLELEATGRINNKWEVFASSAFMHSNIDKASGQQANTQGKIPINTPKYTYSLWSTYKLSPYLKIGGGIEGAGLRYGNATNTNCAPSYNRVDALLEYNTPYYAIKANVFNLFNKKYIDSVYAGHATFGTSRAVQVTFSTRF